MPRKKNQGEIILEFKEIHGDKYDYSNVNYVNSMTKVIIGCPEHGDFEQTPLMHLQGQRCPQCYGNIKWTTEKFIKEAKENSGPILIEFVVEKHDVVYPMVPTGAALNAMINRPERVKKIKES